MKIKPVLAALEARGADVSLVHTGQHYDAAMNDIFFEELGIRAPDYYLGAGSGTHAVQTARVMTEFEPLVEQIRPDLVVEVQPRVLLETDGPMLRHGLQEMNGTKITVPQERRLRPDRRSLEERYEGFRDAS